ncbi:MAG TPA: hypothetical protein VIY86_00275, partial [Pirellulaceae bacterium]
QSGDQGPIDRGSRPAGHLRLVEGRFPEEAACVQALGEGFDLFISKNTLKKGYVHPEREVDPRRLLGLKVSDAEFVAAVARLMKPGGLVMIYNICPAPSPPDQPYIPWADGRCPFPRQVWESAGFEVLTFDRDDSPDVRKMAHLLKWDQGEGAMDLEQDLFAMYSLFRREE